MRVFRYLFQIQRLCQQVEANRSGPGKQDVALAMANIFLEALGETQMVKNESETRKAIDVAVALNNAVTNNIVGTLRNQSENANQ